MAPLYSRRAASHANRFVVIHGCVLLLAGLFGIFGFGGAAIADEQWDRATFPDLFPAQLDGWMVGEVQVTELDTITSDFEAMAGALGALNGSDAVPPSVRLQLTRQYTADVKQVDVAIDTEDINTTSLIQTAHENEEVRAQLAEGGVEAQTIQSYPALVSLTEPEKVIMLKVGDVGLVALGCEYGGCEADLTSYLGRLDFEAIRRFIEFDHRRAVKPEPEED